MIFLLTLHKKIEVLYNHSVSMRKGKLFFLFGFVFYLPVLVVSGLASAQTTQVSLSDDFFIAILFVVSLLLMYKSKMEWRKRI